jgi:Mn2+/Fe2+ NRAMP family transporter
MDESHAPRRADNGTEDPPQTIGGILKQLGPGLIIAASIVGSGELIVTTKLGADVGFILLWFIILGCLVKVFVQIELGRYAIAHGRTTLQAIDRVPGPRLGFGWMVYFWLAMYVATFFQLAGIVGSIAEIFRLGGSTWDEQAWAIAVTLSCAVLLAIGRYRVIERVSSAMVAGFSLFTILAVGALAWTPYSITPAQLASGFNWQLPDDFTIAFAAFGIIGVGASELIYYPYWCLEKGYARAVGPNDGSDAWTLRARGWLRVLATDAWVSMVIYTGATIAFYMLGAAVLHGKGVRVTDQDLIASLSHMYSESFGVVGLWGFLLGAFIVLYSTVFIATASNGRLCADLLNMCGLLRRQSDRDHARLVRVTSALLPIVYLTLFVFVKRPLHLVLIGALAQALMLPLLCLAALYFHHRESIPQLRAGFVWTLCLWTSSLLMMSAGAFELCTRVADLLSGS